MRSVLINLNANLISMAGCYSVMKPKTYFCFWSFIGTRIYFDGQERLLVISTDGSGQVSQENEDVSKRATLNALLWRGVLDVGVEVLLD